MLHIAIVEDEENYSRELEEYIHRYGEETSRQFKVTHFQDGEDIVESYSGGFDLLLMDIQMEFMDGMTAAEKIRERDQEVQIIFITNRNDYAIRGYEVDAITISTKNGVRRIKTEELYYIESDAHNLIYHTVKGDYTTRERIKDAEKILENKGFFRSNKCYLVNLQHVDGIHDGCCEIHGDKLLISRARRGEFMEALSRHMGS